MSSATSPPAPSPKAAGNGYCKIHRMSDDRFSEIAAKVMKEAEKSGCDGHDLSVRWVSHHGPELAEALGITSEEMQRFLQHLSEFCNR